MGRIIPMYENDDIINPFVSLPFMAAGMAATIAIIAALCGRRRKSDPHLDKTSNTSEAIEITTTMSPPTTESDNVDESDPLPPPPGLKHLTQSYSTKPTRKMNKSTSSQNLKATLNLKMPRSLSVAKLKDHIKDKERGDNNHKKVKLKPQDSVWKKAIILGEKCRVNEEDDAFIYDAKGNRIPAFHRKTTSAFPVSQTSSFIDQDVIPDPAPEKDEMKKDDSNDRKENNSSSL